MTRIIGYSFAMIVGVGVMAGAYFLAKPKFILLLYGKKTMGSVVDNVERVRRNDDGRVVNHTVTYTFLPYGGISELKATERVTEHIFRPKGRRTRCTTLS